MFILPVKMIIKTGKIQMQDYIKRIQKMVIFLAFISGKENDKRLNLNFWGKNAVLKHYVKMGYSKIQKCIIFCLKMNDYVK